MRLNLSICLACRKEAKAGPCGGACPCPHDPAGANISRHATSGQCPKGKFRLTGDAMIDAMGYDVETARAEAKRKSCCDPPAASVD